MIEPRDTEAIAKAVKSVYNNEIKDGNKKTFNWDECVDRYIEAYDEIVNIGVKGS